MWDEAQLVALLEDYIGRVEVYDQVGLGTLGFRSPS
jgi:hypothetical protein